MHRLVILLFIALLSARSASAQKGHEKSSLPAAIGFSDPARRFEREFFFRSSDSMCYRLRYPPNYTPRKKYPVVIYLHGSGAQVAQNDKPPAALPEAFTRDSIYLKYPFFLLVPQCPAHSSWVDFPGFPHSLRATDTPTLAGRMVIGMTKQWSRRPDVDPQRIYLAGHSAGGEGTLDLLAREPTLYAAGITVSPVGDTAKAGLIKNIPIWMFHGAKDSVNEVKYARLVMSSSGKVNGNMRYTEFPDEGHRIASKAFASPGLFQWLLKQRRRDGKGG